MEAHDITTALIVLGILNVVWLYLNIKLHNENKKKDTLKFSIHDDLSSITGFRIEVIEPSERCKKCDRIFILEVIPFGTSEMCCECWDKEKK